MAQSNKIYAPNNYVVNGSVVEAPQPKPRSTLGKIADGISQFAQVIIDKMSSTDEDSPASQAKKHFEIWGKQPKEFSYGITYNPEFVPLYREPTDQPQLPSKADLNRIADKEIEQKLLREEEKWLEREPIYREPISDTEVSFVTQTQELLNSISERFASLFRSKADDGFTAYENSRARELLL